jgi:hypothetical protein
MRTLKLHFPDDALPTLDTFVKQTREARVFRRAQAVREVVKGQRLQTVSDALSFRGNTDSINEEVQIVLWKCRKILQNRTKFANV